MIERAGRSLSVKEFDDVCDALDEPQERCYDFVPSQPGYNFVEGYLHGEIGMAVRQREREIGNRPQYGFIIEALSARHSGHHKRTLSAGGVSELKTESGVNTGADKPFVLAMDVKMVEGPDGIISSSVRLERFDDRAFTLGKPLFAFNAFQRINHVLIGGEDRKMRVFARLYAIACGQSGGEKIERTAQRVDDSASPSIERARQRIEVGYSQLAVGIRIRLEPEFIRVIVDPSAGGLLEEWDLGYGPIGSGLSV